MDEAALAVEARNRDVNAHLKAVGPVEPNVDDGVVRDFSKDLVVEIEPVLSLDGERLEKRMALFFPRA